MSAIDTSATLNTSTDPGASDANTSALNTSQTLAQQAQSTGQHNAEQVVQATSPQLGPRSPQLQHTSPQLQHTSPQLQHNAGEGLNTSSSNLGPTANASAPNSGLDSAANTSSTGANTSFDAANSAPNFAANSEANTASSGDSTGKVDANTSRSFSPTAAATIPTTSPQLSPIRGVASGNGEQIQATPAPTFASSPQMPHQLQATGNVFAPAPVPVPAPAPAPAFSAPAPAFSAPMFASTPLMQVPTQSQLQQQLAPQTYTSPYALKIPNFAASASETVQSTAPQMQPTQATYSLISHYPSSNPYSLESVSAGAYGASNVSSPFNAVVSSNKRNTTVTATTPSTAAQSLTTWSAPGDAMVKQGTKENPLHINQCIEILDRMALTTPTAGTKDSQHFAVRFINADVHIAPGSFVTVGKDNSTTSPTYYADVNVDIAKSRADKDLQTKGYYELKGSGIGIDGALFDAIKSKLRSFKHIVPDATEDKQLRTPIFVSTVGNVRFHPRVFEFYTGKNKDKETMEVYIGNTEDGQASMRRINISYPEYRSYVGKARVIGNFSIVTKANGYIKLIFTCRCLILSGNSRKMVGGLEFDAATTSATDSSVPSNVDATEWKDLMKLLHELVNSGVPVHMLSRVLKDGVDSAIGAATKDSKYQMPQATNVHPQPQQMQQLQQQYQMPSQLQPQPQQMQQLQQLQSLHTQYQMPSQLQQQLGQLQQQPQQVQQQLGQLQQQPQMQYHQQLQAQQQPQQAYGMQMQPQMQPQTQPIGAQYVTNLAQRGLHNMGMYSSNLPRI